MLNSIEEVLPRNIIKALNDTFSKISRMDVNDFVNKYLYEPSIHLLKVNGKGIRPALVLLDAMINNLDIEDYENLAASIELLHVASLIHDDIIDDDEIRRGVKTVHKAFSIPEAILAGDALISKAIMLASPYGKDVIDLLSNTAMQMSAGEIYEYRLRADKEIGLEEYIRICELKSASLIGASISVVDLSISNNLFNKMFNFGVNLGVAFQIRDDIIDYTMADSRNISKNERSNKANIVNIYKGSVDNAIRLNNGYIDKALSFVKDTSNFNLLKEIAESLRVLNTI
ncbi:MAG: geranylgeranyl diphosphate synthase [Candidatus Micrarchaeota archaeon]|nr:MAG: geranylgeranyl diphosphate synthase [Candidatus Micrarchaeota archaeon]